MDEEAKARLGFDVERAGIAACDAAGMDRGRADTDRMTLEAWVRRWNLDTQVLPAIRAAAARPNYRPPRSLAYFTGIIEQFVADVGYRPVSAAQRTAAGDHYDRPWDKIVGDWKDQREALSRGERTKPPFWIGDWGPTPDKSGCFAPREVLVRHGFRKPDA